MSVTINIDLTPEDGWLEIPYTGFITASKSVEFIVFDGVPPESLIGHHMKTFGGADFTDSSSTLYVRGKAVIIITEGNAFSSSGEPAPEGLYEGFRAVTTQSYTEANAKNGVQHEISVFVDNAPGGGVSDTLFITGSKPVILKERIASYTGDGVLLEIYEGATYSVLGVTVPSYNLSRIIATSPEATFYSASTITGQGVKAYPDEYLIGNVSNQGNGGTGLVIGRERILKANTVYLFKATSLDSAAQDIWLFDSFYEGEPDLPLG